MNITTLIPDENGDIEWPDVDKDRRIVITLGSFDGMHRGHQAVIDRVVELAKQHDAGSAVMLFDPRPAFVHAHGTNAPEVDADALTGVGERIAAMEQAGIEQVYVVRYTLAFAEKSYIFFLGQLTGKLGMRTLVLGADAALGAGRKGDVHAIANLAAATGVFELDVVDDRGPGEVRIPRDWKPQMPAEWGEPVDPLANANKAQRRAWSKKHQARPVRTWSSSNVRYLLGNGRIKDADAILGHPHAVTGEVVHGEERGRSIGFPTANLGTDITGYLPVDGVYAGWLVDLGETPKNDDPDALAGLARAAASAPRWPAAISIGTKPTFSEATGRHERVVEAYCLSEDWLDLYGHTVRVEFAGFLRPQVKFDGADELVAELKRNVETTRQITAGERN
ncbi:bifunctional riboflavin kinase/FMN adenylyltransferase [Bifidobacterium sp. DSM 109960]|uniref:Bifunctional riboflavin kinase/FMN adenylyltransferase n=1 Tax=Bifidobacterium erythrocebi TaxID=2675325 RepID=A0A7Y0HWA0_9BIFI|nr:riboflavin kinase [Bifidobacterium sp. DSM 109960]NMM96709.1 bifunctional riboflavin kinase/FMN adenylyltransferase [Bifidobacterium sp. DSM 109960]